MYILVIAAGVALSAETVTEIVEIVQDDVFIEQVEIMPPNPETIAFLRSSTDDIESICLEYLYEYQNVDTPMHQTGRSDARTQYETVSKTVEYYQGKNPYF